MKTNNINTNSSLSTKNKKESFGRIKRKYQRPIHAIEYWEALVISKQQLKVKKL